MQNLAPLLPSLLGFGLNLVRLCVWLVLLIAIFVPLEQLFARRRQGLFRTALVTDLGYYFLNGLATGALLGLPLAVAAAVFHRLLPGAYLDMVEGLPLWARLGAAVLVAEIGFYWGHRWCYELPALWRFHAIHHSAEHVDFLVNTRAHPVDLVFTRLCGLVLLDAVGLASPAGRNGGIAAVLLLIGTAWGFFIHANLRWRLGPLEQLVTTPAFHHWHHTLADHTNRNYAPLLPWIDRLFGSFYLPKAEWPVGYGLDTPTPRSLLRQLFDPLIRARPLVP
jgi:sterol desaturase/sphingolipid hydroxylase (fatty acid hydroxylase superfamily)